jgi:hypothetical protein
LGIGVRDRNETTIADLHFAMKLNKPLRLPAVLGTETSATEDQNHGMLAL